MRCRRCRRCRDVPFPSPWHDAQAPACRAGVVRQPCSQMHTCSLGITIANITAVTSLVLLAGYWRRDELTAEKFLDTLSYGRIYRTGDAGYTFSLLWQFPVLRYGGGLQRENTACALQQPFSTPSLTIPVACGLTGSRHGGWMCVCTCVCVRI